MRKRRGVNVTEHHAAQQVFQMQADATYAGTPTTAVPVAVLATTKNVRIISIHCNPVIVGGAAHTAEIHVTIDGIVTTFAVAAATGTDYYAETEAGAAAGSQTLGTTNYARERAFLLEGRSVAVTFELTTDGTPGASTARVKYAKIP